MSSADVKITTRKEEPLYATLLTLAASGFDIGKSVVFDGENSVLMYANSHLLLSKIASKFL